MRCILMCIILHVSVFFIFFMILLWPKLSLWGPTGGWNKNALQKQSPSMTKLMEEPRPGELSPSLTAQPLSHLLQRHFYRADRTMSCALRVSSCHNVRFLSELF